MPSAPALLEEILGHTFRDASLLRLALRHASTTHDRTLSNERMEFLGDRVLGLAVAHLLYARFVHEEEGDLAKRFSGLTSREALARIADTIKLGDFIQTQATDVETHKRSQPSVNADTLEAILGALFLDGGLAIPVAFITTHWEPLIGENLTPPKDAKTALQEWAQARSLGLPVYAVHHLDGPDHAPTFTISVTVKGEGCASGQGGSRRIAEQEAAFILLEKLENKT